MLAPTGCFTLVKLKDPDTQLEIIELLLKACNKEAAMMKAKEKIK